MAEKKVIVNPVSVEFTDRNDKGFVTVFDGHYETSYNMEEWDVKVSVELTKREKPIPVGTVVVHEVTGHYIKMPADWWWWLGGKTPQKANNQDDAWYRGSTLPMHTGSWD